MDSQHRLVNLDPETIAKLNYALQEGRSMDEVQNIKNELPDLQLEREFRSRNLALVHSLLQNPLQQLISTVPPVPTVAISNFVNSKKGKELSPNLLFGLLYMYDNHLPTYRDDGLQWEATKKMCVKLVVFNSEQNTYKLKNSKTDQGVVVMRRQTWKGLQGYWRKHEYKLIRHEQFYRPEADGSLSVNEIQKLQDFPVLVHYFCKHPEDGALDEPAPNPPVTNNPQMKSRKRRKLNHADSDTEDSKPDLSGPVNYQPPKALQPQISPPRSATAAAPATSTTSSTSSTSSSGSGSGSGGAPLVPSITSSNNGSFRPTFSLSHLKTSFGTIPGLSFSGLFSQSPSSNNGYYLDPRLSNSSVPADLASLLAGTSTEFPDYQTQLVRSSDTLIAPPLATSASIMTYAPDIGPHLAPTKVIVQVKGFPTETLNEHYRYTCMFEQFEIPLVKIADGVFEFIAPAQPTAGIVFFWCVCKSAREIDRTTLYSNAVPFFYTPVDESGHLTLHFESVHVSSPEDRVLVVNKFRFTVRELDLSNNALSNLDFLADMTQLHTLILDTNFITSDTEFPLLSKLKTLSVNGNRIANLELFIDRVKAAFPALQYLSMLDNEACPYFSARPHHYYNYRIYVISCLPTLTHLNSSAVTMEELRHATSIMERKGKQTPALNYPTTPSTPSTPNSLLAALHASH